MLNYLFEVDNKKIIVKAEDENDAWSFFDTTEENLGDAPLVDYLGWCTDEVAEELGYEVYQEPTPKGLTIKELYAWAQANGCEDMQFVYCDDYGTYRTYPRHPSEYVVSDTEICLFEY